MKNIKKWLKCAAIRAVKTFFQTILSLIPLAVRIDQINWFELLLTGLTAFAYSIISSMAGLPECKENEIKGENENDN